MTSVDPAVLPNRKEPKANPSGDGKKDIISGLSSAREEDNLYAKVYHKDGTEVDLTKNSLPSGAKYEKVNIAQQKKDEFKKVLSSFLIRKNFTHRVK